MMEVAAVTAISGKGFVGDASLGSRNRQVLLVDKEILNEVGVKPGDVRENVTIEGFELSGLTPQRELMIGEVLLAVTRRLRAVLKARRSAAWSELRHPGETRRIGPGRSRGQIETR